MKNIRVFVKFWLVLAGAGIMIFGQYPAEKTQPSGFKWPENKKCALSLTFDDARPSQLDVGIPILNHYGLNATFYVSPGYLEDRVEDWKQVSLKGHEIGNHSMTHPCSGNFYWSRNNALENYSLDSIRADIESANRFIQEKLGVHPKSFAYPCGQKFVGRGSQVRSYVPVIQSMFHSGRGWLDESANDPNFVDFGQVLGMELDSLSFEEVKQLIDEAAANSHWLVLCGHEIGDSGPQTTLKSTLESICQYVKSPKNRVWMDTVENVGRHIRQHRNLK